MNRIILFIIQVTKITKSMISRCRVNFSISVINKYALKPIVIILIVMMIMIIKIKIKMKI